MNAAEPQTSEEIRLRAQLAALKASLVDEAAAAKAPWPLSPTERRIFGMLLAQDTVSKRTIALVLNDGREPEPSDLKGLDVFLSRIRAKVAKADVRIQTIHGVGYQLCDREALAKALSWADSARL